MVEKVGSEIKINLFPKQEEFVNSEIDDILFGGSAGPGKTSALLIFGVLRRIKYPNSMGLALRRTFPELQASIIKRSKEMYPLFGGVYHESNKEWKFPNGSIQRFGYLETDADAYRYHSDEYQDISFDEASLFTQFQVTYLTSRCRSTLPGCKPLIRLASNPGGVGHSFLKKRYIDPGKISKTWWDDRTKKHLSFIPAKLIDNPAMMEADPNYIHRLRELGEKKYLALAEGSWEVFEGAFFPEFDPRPGFGVCDRLRVPESDTFKFVAMDWGYAEPCCILWFEVMPSGRIYVYREVYVTLKNPKELAQIILDETPDREKLEYLVAPPELWGKKSEMEGGGETIHDLMQVVLGDKLPIQKATNARVAGWTKMREFLSLARDGRPWLQVSPNCDNLIRTLPTMMYNDKDTKDPNDMSTKGEDHACLVGCTKVLTRNGEMNISDLVGTSGEIWTASGWRRYFDCRMTRKNAEVVELSGGGLSVVLTPDHRVLTNNGWREAGALNSSDLIVRTEWKIQSLYLKLASRFVARIITYVENISKIRMVDCIEKCGNFIMERFLPSTTFIIKTIYGAITGPKILSFSNQASIYLITWTAKKERPWPDEVSKRQLRPLSFGTTIQKTGISTFLLEKRGGERSSQGGRLNWFAKVVLLSMKHFDQGVQDFVTLIARCVTTGSTIQKSENISWSMIEKGNADVYNLEVEDVHSFAVNGGIVLHNCDASRYALMSLQNIQRGDIEENLSPYERLFGRQGEDSNIRHIPSSGRGGYG